MAEDPLVPSELHDERAAPRRPPPVHREGPVVKAGMDEPERHARVPWWFPVAAFLILAVPGLQLLVNHSPLGGMVIQALKNEAGLDVSSLHIRLLPRLTIEASDLVLRSDRQPDAVLHASRATLRLRLLPLLHKRLAVVRIVLREPQVVVLRDREGRWHVPWDRARPAPQDGGGGGLTWQWLVPDVTVTDGRILMLDDFERDATRTISIHDVQGLVDSDLLRRVADLTLTGSMGESRMALSGTLALLAYAPSVRFEGAVQIDRFDLAPWIASPAESARRAARPRLIDVVAQVALRPGQVGHDLTVSGLHARMDWMTLRAQGTVEGIDVEPRYAATLSATPVAVAALLEELPAAWLPPKIRAAVVEQEMSGTVELVSASVNGAVHHPQGSTWQGTAKLSQGAALVGPERTSVKDLAATLFLDPVRVEALNISGQVGGLRVSDGRIDLAHMDVAPTVDVALNGAGKVRDLVDLLNDFSAGTAGETVLKAITDPQGEVQLSIRGTGSLDPVPRLDLVGADITLHGLGAFLPRLNLSAEHLDGTVGIRPNFIEFKHLRGTIGPMHFDVVGGAELEPTPRFDDVRVELSAEASDLTQALGALPDELTIEGAATAAVRVSGPVSSPRWQGRIDLTQAAILAPPVLHKRRGVATSLEFEGRSPRTQRLSLRQVTLVLPSARVEGRADVRWGDRPSFTVRLRGGLLPIEGLADVFSLGPLSAGVISGDLSIEGHEADWRSWTTSGWIETQRGAVTVQGLRDSIRELSMKLQAAGRDLLIQRLSFKIGDSDVTATGLVKQWATSPSPTLLLESSKLDLSRLMPSENGGEGDADGFQRIRRWCMTYRADVTVSVTQAHYHRLAFRTLSSHLHAEPGRFTLEVTKGETPEGNVSGELTAVCPPREPVAVEAEMAIDGLPVHQLLSVFDPDAERLRGLLSLKGSLTATIHRTVPVLGTVNSRGPFNLRLIGGRVMHGTVLPKLLKMLNVPALLKERVDFDRDGIPFDTVSATVTALDGVLSSEDLLFDSPLIKVTGAGTLAMLTTDLNLALAVSPLGSYSDLIEKIPFFGRLLEGDRPGLTTALFEVTGPLNDPDVRYLPIESIAKGLTGYPRIAIDVLRNAITLPQDLLTPDTP